MRLHVKLMMKASVFMKSTCMLTTSLPRTEKLGTKEECTVSLRRHLAKEIFLHHRKVMVLTLCSRKGFFLVQCHQGPSSAMMDPYEPVKAVLAVAAPRPFIHIRRKWTGRPSLGLGRSKAACITVWRRV